MEKNPEMIGVKREEEIELELGLSIGGGFQRSEKLNPSHAMAKNEPPASDLRENHHNNSDRFQVESKREIEALRRLEAKRKRQEKQQKKITISCNNIIGSGYGVGLDNKMWLKSPALETKEQQRECKKSRVEDEAEESRPRSNVEMKNVNLNLTVDQNVGFNSTVCPVMYPYPPVQYVQFANGFQYPCLNVVPCWPAGGEGVENYQVQPVVNRSFRPFQSGQDSGRNMGNGCASDQNSWKAGSNGSPVCSSSVVSDYRSSSHEGGGSSDTRSHSSHSLSEQCKLQNSKVNDTKGQSKHTTSPHREIIQVYDETSTCPTNSVKPNTSSNDAQCSQSTNCTTNFVQQKTPSNAVLTPTKPKEEVATELHGASSQNPVLTTENLSPSVSKESKKDVGKPPKPQTHSQNTPSLPHMPCVSTTGNGPNGKTINGFLCRYTKTEISIVCVCHGTSFSPAEFVLHAGGTDVSQPLKQITVIPSDL